MKETQPGEVGLAEDEQPIDLAYTFGAFRLVPKERRLLLESEPIHLGSRAFAILAALVERAGTIVSAHELMRLVWPGMTVEEANLRVQLGSLRKVLARGEGGRQAIETVPLRGYCFVLPVVQSKAGLAVRPTVEAEHNLPTLLTKTVGRDAAIELVSKSLATHRLVTIIGPGGIGKTTLALAVAHRSLALFAEGRALCGLFVPLGPAAGCQRPRIRARHLRAFPENPLTGLLTRLSGKRMLILLDTCEHVVDAAAALAETLLAELPPVHILATSREALRSRGEWVFRLPSLALPSTTGGLTVEAALAFSSVELFVQRATASQDQFELSDADAPIVAGICRRLDGIPLAIEFAAARVDDLGLREIAARLHDRFSVLTRGRRTALPRHQTLSATLSWSYDLLRPDEQTTLCRLAIFRGQFTAEAAVAVVEDEAGGRRRALDTL